MGLQLDCSRLAGQVTVISVSCPVVLGLIDLREVGREVTSLQSSGPDAPVRSSTRSSVQKPRSAVLPRPWIIASRRALRSSR